MRQFRLNPLFRLQIIQQTYLQSLQTQANGVFVGRGRFWQIWEKGGRMIPNYKVLWANIVLWENLLNYFGSCLQDRLYCSPLIYYLSNKISFSAIFSKYFFIFKNKTYKNYVIPNFLNSKVKLHTKWNHVTVQTWFWGYSFFSTGLKTPDKKVFLNLISKYNS